MLQIALPAKIATKHMILGRFLVLVWSRNPYGKIKVKDIEMEEEEENKKRERERVLLP